MAASLIGFSFVAVGAFASISIEHRLLHASEQKGPTLHHGVR
jgi:uncharacterized membrane protein YgdD (TMEM256/DUF423 family)